MKYRLESDSIGEKQVPADSYYGVQSLRAAENFQITSHKMNDEMINSLVQIKKAAAISNGKAKILDERKAAAIEQACDEILEGKFHDQFIVDAIQGGAGTSANMNANEVVANRAIEILGGTKGDYSLIHPNDHVNMCQSTNDVYPTAGKLTVLKLLPAAIDQLKRLRGALRNKSQEFDEVFKIGRTQLQEAVPIRLGQEFGAYFSVVNRDIARLEKAGESMKVVNLGGTAIGTCINADARYLETVLPTLCDITGLSLTRAENLVDATQNMDSYVDLSSALKTCAVNLSKISNDLRLMSSGPKAGFGDIILPPKQNGSSIMPGKINPVIPEVMNQVTFNLVGNDLSIAMAAEAGQMELNAFEPVIFYNLFESITTLTGGVRSLTDNCVAGITANTARCAEMVNASCGLATVVSPYIGYKKAVAVAKLSLKTGKPVKKILMEDGVFDQAEIENMFDLKKMTLCVGKH